MFLPASPCLLSLQPAIPVFTATLGTLLGQEAAHPRKLAGIGLAVSGAVSMVRGLQVRGSALHELSCLQRPAATKHGAGASARQVLAMQGGYRGRLNQVFFYFKKYEKR